MSPSTTLFGLGVDSRAETGRQSLLVLVAPASGNLTLLGPAGASGKCKQEASMDATEIRDATPVVSFGLVPSYR